MKKSERPFISVRDVTKCFDNKEILSGISLDIFEGERIGLVGKVGSGKTTLLNIIGGVKGYQPDGGEVIFHVAFCRQCSQVNLPSISNCPTCGSTLSLVDLDMWGDGDAQLRKAIKTRLGMMFQKSYGVYGNLTALENTLSMLSEVGLDKKAMYNKAAEILESANLMHRSSHLANDLSGGEKQRLVLARQMARNPMVLLADDPTGALDPANASMVAKTLSTIPGVGVLVVTSHIPMLIDTICTRAVLLDQGKVIGIGSPHSITAKIRAKGPTQEDRKVPDSGQPIIRLVGVSKIFHKVTSGVVKAINDVDLTISEGVIIGLVGKSGAGKTTLSKIIAGGIRPTRGSVGIRIGDDWVDLSQQGALGKGRATRYISTLYQEYSLYSYMSVFENLAKSKDLHIPDEFVKMKAVHTLKKIGFPEKQVKEILARCPDDLSEGERHRVALAWSLMRDPRILILDEPSGTMDPMTKGVVGTALRNLRQEFGTTIVIVSHDVEFALNTCDVLVMMENGKITIVGTPSEVIEEFEGISALYPHVTMPPQREIAPESGVSRRELD